MSDPEVRSGTPPAAQRDELRWAAWALATALTLFVSYFCLRPYVFLSPPEGCHTGAIALDVIEHGFRFPLRAYAPEIYEPGIVIEGLLATPFFRVFGPTFLALELLPLAVSTITVLLGFALLDRVLPTADAARGGRRVVARLAYLAFFAFGPTIYVSMSMSAVGDHHEGAALALGLVVLLFRRWEAETRGRFAALWLAAGFFSFWEKGVLLVAAIAVARELRTAWVRRAPRPLAAGALLFLVGYAPGLYVNFVSGFADVGVVGSKFEARALLRGIGDCAFGLWLMIDRSPVVAAGFLVALGGYALQVLIDVRARRSLSPAAILGVVTWGYLALVAGTKGVNLPYQEYGFPVMALPLAALAARAALALSTRIGRLASGASMITLFSLALRPGLQLDLGHPAAMLEDTGHAACGWRFGRAFLRVGRDLPRAAKACQTLGGERALACVAGLGVEQRSGDLTGSADERRAFAFGVGQAAMHDGGRAETCPSVNGLEERAACELGTTVECLTYADLVHRLLVGSALAQPRCPLADAPFGEFPAALIEGFRRRPPSDAAPSHDIDDVIDPVCRRVLAACYGEVGESAAPRPH